MRAFDPEIWREVTGGGVADRIRRLLRVTPLVPAPALGRRTAADPGLTFVSAFDDDYVIAGNGGLLARELLAQLPDVDTVMTPVGGGGLAAGLGVELVPRGLRLLGVQPEANCAMKRSLEDGRAYTRYDGRPTLAEG